MLLVTGFIVSCKCLGTSTEFSGYKILTYRKEDKRKRKKKTYREQTWLPGHSLFILRYLILLFLQSLKTKGLCIVKQIILLQMFTFIQSKKAFNVNLDSLGIKAITQKTWSLSSSWDRKNERDKDDSYICGHHYCIITGYIQVLLGSKWRALKWDWSKAS